jgi:hypothetical protein
MRHILRANRKLVPAFVTLSRRRTSGLHSRLRGAPHVGFSATMRKISSRSSLLTHFRPARALCREHHVQYNLKPARCQRTPVSGWTMTSVRLHPDQNPRSITQKTLSEVASLGRGCRALRTVSCCRKAKISNSKSRREHKLQAIRPMNSLSIRSIHGLYQKMPPNFSPDSILASHRYLVWPSS